MSREYALFKPQFWSGKTGRQITRRGKDARIVADYLVTSPHSNLIGLYYVAVTTIAYETGLTTDEVTAALAALEELEFARYDHDAEVVFVTTMARYQINWKGPRLKDDDKRARACQREYREVSDNRFLSAFFDLYGEPLRLLDCRGVRSPIEAPSSHMQAPSEGSEKYLPDQDQDHETLSLSDHLSDSDHEHAHDQERETEGEDGGAWEREQLVRRIRERSDLHKVDSFSRPEELRSELLTRFGGQSLALIDELLPGLWGKHQAFRKTVVPPSTRPKTRKAS